MFVLVNAVLSAPQCTTSFKEAGSNGGCYTFDLAQFPRETFMIDDAYPEPYLVSSPCVPVLTANCSACRSSSGTAAAYQLEPQAGCTGGRCFAIGSNLDTSLQMIPKRDPKQGIVLSYSGGYQGRKLVYDLTCNSSAPVENLPHKIKETHSLEYTV